MDFNTKSLIEPQFIVFCSTFIYDTFMLKDLPIKDSCKKKVNKTQIEREHQYHRRQRKDIY